jgi:hypothetical protein
MANLLLLAAWQTLAQKRYEIDNTTDSEEGFHSGDSSSMSDNEGDVDSDAGLDGELDERDNNSNESQQSYIRLTQNRYDGQHSLTDPDSDAQAYSPYPGVGYGGW